MNAIAELQTLLIAALNADAQLSVATGGTAMSDAPKSGRNTLSITISKHDLINRDADASQGFEHQVEIMILVPGINRAKSALIDAHMRRIIDAETFGSPQLVVTHKHHVKTQTRFDTRAGATIATCRYVFFAEPTNS